MADWDEREKNLITEIESLRRRMMELERCEEDRKKAAEAIRSHEALFLDVFNATEEAAFLMDREGTILFANRNAAHLYGMPAENLVGTSVYDHVPRDRVESSREKVKSVLATRQLARFEGKLEGKTFENSLYPVLSDEADVKRIAVYIRDITQRKRLEAVLQRTREKFREIYENAMEGIFQISPEGRFISANPSLARIHGYDSPKEMIDTVDDIPGRYVNPDDYHRLLSLLFEQGSVEYFETQMYRKDGSRHWISMNVRIVRDVQGRILYYEGTMIDITKRKRVEEALAESEERYRTAIEYSNDAVAIIQGDRNQYVNRRFMELFGYNDPMELIGKPIFVIVHPDDLEKVVTINQRRQRGEPVPPRYEFKGLTRVGKIIYIEVSAANIVYRGVPVYLVYFRDITERKLAEEAIQTERNRFRTLVENAPFGIMMVDEQGRFEYINPKFKELFGYRLDEIPNGREWFLRAFPDSKLRKEATATWISYQRSTKSGEKAPQTLPVTCKDGSRKIIHFIPVRLVTGEHIVTLEDITERIQAQETLMKSHEELEGLNRAKTKAMHHISHELKTPLAVIQGNIRLLKRKMEGLPVATHLQNTMGALERNLARLFDISTETDEIFRVSQDIEAGSLLDDFDRLRQRIEALSDIPATVRPHLDAVKAWLSQYLSGNMESFQSVDLFPFVLETLEMIKRNAGHRKIRCEAEGKPGLFIQMDLQILQNVVEGLLRNAVENTPDGGVIRLVVEEKNNRILLHVIDTGIGITEENQPFIFSGLFHTKETELYASKTPYDFGAGGKGLDLLRMKVYGQRFGFDLTLTSRRCAHIPTDQGQCPGVISKCVHVHNAAQCEASGGTTFTVSFPVSKGQHRESSPSTTP